VEYIKLYAVGLNTLIKSISRSRIHNTTPSEFYSLLQEILEGVYSNSDKFYRYGRSEKTISVGQWWVISDTLKDIAQLPLADEVEKFIVNYLQNNPTSTLPTIDTVVCDTFQGLFTPDYTLIKACIESYCQPESIKSGYPRIRTQDLPEVRHLGIMAMRSSLSMIGLSLGFSIVDQQPLVWRDPDSDLVYIFYILTTAAFGNIVFSNPYPASQSFIVIPGGRSRLTKFKLRHNTRLRNAVDSGWRFLKFRHIRRLVNAPIVNRENFIEQFEIDPLSEDDPQLRLL
jgi:hypothetical protein